MFRLFFCKYLYILSLFIAPFIKKKNITYLINRDENKMKIQTYFWKQFYYEISCYNLPLFTLFVQNPWVVHNPWLTRKKYFCHWSSLDHVLSIKTFTDKKNCCVWLFVYLGSTINGALRRAARTTWGSKGICSVMSAMKCHKSHRTPTLPGCGAAKPTANAKNCKCY